jgi:hypothetical protein
VAATFYEPQDDEEPVDNVQDSDKTEKIQDSQADQEPEVPAVEPEEDLPSKYKGKSLSDIVRMHQEAEKLIGRQAQEVGEVRKLADELIKRQLNSPKDEGKATKEDEIDFFADPDTAVAKKIEKHPAILEAKEQTRQLKEMQTMSRLQQEFPDFQATVNDPAFADWVKSSSIRLQLFARAHSEFDFDSAAELLGTWKYVKPKAEPVKQSNAEVKKQQQAAVQQATVDVGGATQAVSSTKVYRRADLIRLQLEDPDRYIQLQPEIMAAYAEGRVK